MAYASTANLVIHVRYNGRSLDVPLHELDIGQQSTDREIRKRLAHRLSINETSFGDCVIDRHSNGNLTLRPQAVFG